MTSVSRHIRRDAVCGLQEWGWSPEPWPTEGIVGWAWLDAKVRLSVGAVGVDEDGEAGPAAKVDLS